MFGTLNVLMNHLLTSQQIYQVKQLTQPLLAKIMLDIYPLIGDATLLNYNSFFRERTGNNSLNSTFIINDNLNGTRNLL